LAVHIYHAFAMVSEEETAFSSLALRDPHAGPVYATHVMMPENRGRVEYSGTGREHSIF
jgi:hypothetical protein